uniref:Uncharacterized protein n=1 Tax=Panagrolaimus superbus TaxID=310955 RepID=A0A914Y5G1_9BILA
MQSTSTSNIPQLINNCSNSGGNGNNGNDKTAPSTPSAVRNRRTLSGSGQTISQHTRDRLKNMIATKKQKQQRLGSSGSSSGSQTNLTQSSTTPSTNGHSQAATAAAAASSSMTSSAGTGSLTWIPPNNSNEPNFIQQLAAAAIQQSSRHHTSSAASSSGGASHFEPYPLPSSANHHQHQQQGQMSEFQLRKVNSEPNLKMRLRARLLNKGSSPVTQQQQQQQQASATSQTSSSAAAAVAAVASITGNPFLPPQPSSSASATSQHRHLQRCDSDSLQFDTFLGSPIETPLAPSVSTTQLPFPANLMIPSPSLPNLCNGFDQLQLDYTNLMLQSAFTSFLSMPSLLKNQLITNSIVDPQQGNDEASSSKFLLDPFRVVVQ